MEQIFMCVCCQELAFQPITTACSHNVCKVCSSSFLSPLFPSCVPGTCAWISRCCSSLCLSTDLSPAVLPSEGVHLPRLPPRPGQRLRHDPKHDATDAARPVLSWLQQGPMRSKQHLYVEYVPTCTKASVLCTHIYRQVPRAPLYNALRTHTVLTHGQMYIAYTAIYVYNHSYTNNLSRHWPHLLNLDFLH